MHGYKGSDLLMKCLANLEVEYVFGLGGHGNLALLDGLYKAKDKLKPILVHDESVGASAAGGYFRATGKPGVLLVTNGPGMIQAIPGLVEQAMQNNAVVVICGDIPTVQAGYGAEEELDIMQDDDQISLFRSFAKRIYKISDPAQIPLTAARAFNCSLSGRTGVVLIDVPVNVQSKEITQETMDRIPDLTSNLCQGKPAGSRKDIEHAVSLLLNAEKPAIVCGVGAVISDASDEIETLATLLDAPVCTAYMSQAAIGGDHPLHAGRVGGWGNAFANQVTREADVVLTIGNRFDEDETGAWDMGDTYAIPPTKLIHIHIDPREIGKIYPVAVGIPADPKEVLQDIISGVKNSGKTFNRGIREAISKAKDEYFREMAPFRNSESVPINPHRVVKEIEEAFPENGIQVGGAICARNYYFHDQPNKAYYGYGMGLIGTSLAQAIGFAIGRTENKIISIEGDGGFLIHSSILATAAEYNLPIVWVVFNNSAYGTVWGLQRQYFENRSVFTEFTYEDGQVYVPDYALMAESFQVKGFRVTQPEEIKPALIAAMGENRPCLIDVVVDRKFSSTPPTVSNCGWDKYYPSW